MSQTCTNGHPIAAKARFCRECGAPATTMLDDSSGARIDPSATTTLPALGATTDATSRSDGDQTTNASPRDRVPMILAIAAGVILLIGVGAAGALLLTDGDDASTAPRTSTTRPVVSTSSTIATTTTTISALVAPTVPLAATRYCVRDDTPLNIHLVPGTYADVIGLIMVGNCQATDPASGPETQFTSDGNASFRRIVWRGLDGWVSAKQLGSSAPPPSEFIAGGDPSCTNETLLAAWEAAELWDYDGDNPGYSTVEAACDGVSAGAIAYARFVRGKLNPDGRMTEAVFRNTGSGWQELSHSGPTLTDVDLQSTGVSLEALAQLRAQAG